MLKAFAAGLGAALLAASAAVAAPVARPAISVGACAWAKVPPAEKTAFLAAYHDEISGGMGKLAEHTDAYRVLVAACLGREGAPGLWADSALGAEAIQDGALAELKTMKNLDRPALEKAWLSAPETARACTRANAAKVFGIDGGACAESRAPLAFLQPLGIVVAPEDQDAVRQALYFFTAKAQSEWAEQLLAKFKIDGLPAKPPAASATVKP